MTFNRQFYIYILASKSRRIYIGMTNSLFHRVLQHRAGEVEFTNRYRINRLVYYEMFKYVNNCIARETELKRWSRAKKVALIESMNPTWEDLAANWGKPIKLLTPDDPPRRQDQNSRFLASLGMTRKDGMTTKDGMTRKWNDKKME